MMFVHCTKNSIKRFLTSSAKAWSRVKSESLLNSWRPACASVALWYCHGAARGMRRHVRTLQRQLEGDNRMNGRRFAVCVVTAAMTLTAACGGKKGEGDAPNKAVVGDLTDKT